MNFLVGLCFSVFSGCTRTSCSCHMCLCQLLSCVILCPKVDLSNTTCDFLQFFILLWTEKIFKSNLYLWPYCTCPRCKNQKRVSGTHYKWLWTTVWFLGRECTISERIASAFKHWAIFPVLKLFLLCSKHVHLKCSGTYFECSCDILKAWTPMNL